MSNEVLRAKNKTTDVKPFGKNFTFAFIDSAMGGKFIPKTKSGIIMTNKDVQEQHNPRWAKVINTGDKVTEFKTDDFVFIEPLKWTTGFEFQDGKLWKSDEANVIAVANHGTKLEDLIQI
jgi:co-chaperonin GroES (HSP10)